MVYFYCNFYKNIVLQHNKWHIRYVGFSDKKSKNNYYKIVFLSVHAFVKSIDGIKKPLTLKKKQVEKQIVAFHEVLL